MLTHTWNSAKTDKINLSEIAVFRVIWDRSKHIVVAILRTGRAIELEEFDDQRSAQDYIDKLTE